LGNLLELDYQLAIAKRNVHFVLPCSSCNQ
jgi:hypothetical protein